MPLRGKEREERDFVTAGDDVLLSALVQVALSVNKLTDRQEGEGLIIWKKGAKL